MGINLSKTTSFRVSTFSSLAARTSPLLDLLSNDGHAHDLGRASTIVTVPDRSRELVLFRALAVGSSRLYNMSVLYLNVSL